MNSLYPQIVIVLLYIEVVFYTNVLSLLQVKREEIVMGWYFWGDTGMHSYIFHLSYMDVVCLHALPYLCDRLKFPTLRLSVPSWRSWNLSLLLLRFIFFCLQKLLYGISPTCSLKSYLSYITFFVFQCDFDRLKLSTAPFMERNLEFLIGCMDDLSSDQNKVLFYFWQKSFSIIYPSLYNLFVWLSAFLAIQFQYYYRNLSRQQSQQQAWLQKRR